MTITAVADAEATPPSVTVTIEAGSPAIIRSARLWRNDAAGRALVASQPASGLDLATIVDYEAPFEEDVVYEWEGTVSDPTQLVPVFTESWSNLLAWSTAAVDAWYVQAGRLRNTGQVSGNGPIQRSLPSRLTGVLTIDDLPLGGIRLSSTLSISVGDGAATLLIGSASTSFAPGTGGWTITVTDESVTIETTAGMTTRAYTGGITQVQFTAGMFGANIPPLSLAAFGAEAEVTEAAPAVRIDPEASWIIHPSKPGLSVPVYQGRLWEAQTFASFGAIERESATVYHYPLGSRFPVPVITSPRRADQLTLIVNTETLAERDAMRALLADGMTLLISTRPSDRYEFRDGYYSVGAVIEDRAVEVPGWSAREWTLPIVEVDRPIVTVQAAGDTWSDRLVSLDTWQDVLDTYDTWLDFLNDNRRMGA